MAVSCRTAVSAGSAFALKMDVRAIREQARKRTLGRGTMKLITTILLGIMSAAFAGSIVGQVPRSSDMRLVAPDEAAWFQRQSPAMKRKIIADLEKARACISSYATRDARREATVAARSSNPRFYSGFSNGVVAYRTVPGIKGCSPTFTSRSEDQYFTELAEAYSGPPRTMKVQMLCGEAASKYAASFNRTLASMKPGAFHEACPTGQLEAK